MSANTFQISASKQRRYNKTWEFMSASIKSTDRILDIGTANPFSEMLTAKGFTVLNTKGEDLDEQPEILKPMDADIATAFEIFEHLLNPLGVLKNIPTQKIFASVPLSLWFAKSYRNKTERWDQHFHEFEDWQFDWLLEKGGWEIVRREKWTSPTPLVGVRPLLRRFIPRYYIIEAVRK